MYGRTVECHYAGDRRLLLLTPACFQIAEYPLHAFLQESLQGNCFTTSMVLLQQQLTVQQQETTPLWVISGTMTNSSRPGS